MLILPSLKAHLELDRYLGLAPRWCWRQQSCPCSVGPRECRWRIGYSWLVLGAAQTTVSSQPTLAASPQCQLASSWQYLSSLISQTVRRRF